MSATKTVVQTAGEELGDLINLILDGTPNKEQIVQFATEGFQAVQALAAVGIPATDKLKVVTNLLEGLIRKVNEVSMALPK